MKIQFDLEIENLKHMLIDMATAADKMIELSNLIFLERDYMLVDEVYDIEDKVNHLEVDIEKTCVSLIARHQPTASDLRLIVAVIQMSNQLERLGDLAVNVAKRYKDIAKIPPHLFPADLRSLVTVSSQMVKDAMTAFIDRDAKMAHEICLKDDWVDMANRKIWKEFIRKIVENGIDLETGFEMLMTSKQYERIADCATNLAEEVIYYLNGENIKHRFQEETTEPS